MIQTFQVRVARYASPSRLSLMQGFEVQNGFDVAGFPLQTTGEWKSGRFM
jgi:hypothetical protein